MASKYPKALDSLATESEDRQDNKTGTAHLDEAPGSGFHADLHNEVNEAVNAIEKELGIEPSGASSDLAARLKAIEEAIEGAGAVDSVNGKTGEVTGLEETKNKVQTLSGESEAEYPSEKAVQIGLATKPTATLDTDGTLAANSDTAVASQKAVKTYADTKEKTANKVQILSGESESEYPSEKAVQVGLATKPTATLDTDGTLAANSDTKVASQKATKTYADLRELLANKDTDSTFAANSDTKYPSQKAVKTALALKEDVANKDTTATLGTSDTKYPSQKAVKTYADAVKTVIPFFNVKDTTYGAKGDGSTDDSTAIQAAIDAASAVGGGTVFFPPGTYIVGTTLTLKTAVRLQGANVRASVVKLKNSVDKDILTTASYGSGGIANAAISQLSFHGNKANNTKGNGLKLDWITSLLDWVFVLECEEDGILETKSAVDGTIREFGDMDSFARNVKVWDCEGNGINWDGHDCHFTDIVCLSNAKVNFLLNSNSDAAKCNAVHSYGASLNGIVYKSSNCRFVNCEAEGATNANVLIEGDNGQWIGGEVFADSENNGKIGFEWASGKGFNTLISGVRTKNQTSGSFKFTGNGANSVISGLVYGTEKEAITGSPDPTVDMSMVRLVGGVTPGNSLIRSPNLRTVDPWKPSVAIAENMPRWGAVMTNLTTLTSGTLYLVGGMILPADVPVNKIIFFSGTQKLETGSNQWFCLCNQERKVLRKTNDATNGAWEANSEKELTLSSAYTPERDEPVYVGIMVKASTVPSLRGELAIATTAISKSPAFAGTSTASLTNPASLGETAGAITAKEQLPYCIVL